MNVVTVLHNKAMEFADEALLARMEGNAEAAFRFFEKALSLEKEAAHAVESSAADPAPRYILIRSAASLAVQSGNFQEAQELIDWGLAGDPPDFIQQELAELAATLHAMQSTRVQTGKENDLELIGIITDANASKSQITVRDIKSDRLYTLRVPQALMNEIVRSYWADTVRIQARQQASGSIVLSQIGRAA